MSSTPLRTLRLIAAHVRKIFNAEFAKAQRIAEYRSSKRRIGETQWWRLARSVETSSFFSGTARTVRSRNAGGLAPFRYKSNRELISLHFLSGVLISSVLTCSGWIDRQAVAEDWPRFLGPGGSATSTDDSIPQTWDDDNNLRWKTPLPGAGSSSPIVVGDRVFVTCYSGYGVPNPVGSSGSSTNDLIRHLVCLDRTNGKILWQQQVANQSREDSYQGYLTEHGYASGTPVSDGQHVYCFFGKSGVVAFDVTGKQVWQTSVGQESSDRRWGSGSSLILYGDKVIVNAAEESQAMVALNKMTGDEVWRKEASSLNLTFGTPTIVKIDNPTDGQRSDLVIAVPGELWGFNPNTGGLRWYVEHDLTGNISPSLVVGKDRVFVFGGYRSAGSLAVRPGGKDDMTDMSVLWTSRNSSYVATPALHDDHLYWISDRGQALCSNATTGEEVYRKRVSEIKSSGRPVYASPVIVGDKIYVPTRHDGVLVLAANPQYEVLAQNKFSDDESDFNASVAVSDGQLFIRSDKYLYCVGNQ